jgi:hypothetical protein
MAFTVLITVDSQEESAALALAVVKQTITT